MMQAQAVTSPCSHPCLVHFCNERPAPLSTAALSAGHPARFFLISDGEGRGEQPQQGQEGGGDPAQLACHTMTPRIRAEW